MRFIYHDFFSGNFFNNKQAVVKKFPDHMSVKVCLWQDSDPPFEIDILPDRGYLKEESMDISIRENIQHKQTNKQTIA